MTGRAVDRRALIFGAAGSLVLAGCSGSSRSGASKGPVVNAQDPGNVITLDEMNALADRVGAAFKKLSIDDLKAVLGPNIDEKQWLRRMQGVGDLPLAKSTFVIEKPYSRMGNASGGKIEFDANLAYVYQVRDCDASPVSQLFRLSLEKQSTDDELRVAEIHGPTDEFSPALWDLARVEVIETRHAVIAVREEEADLARKYSSQIDAGAAEAMDLITPAKGISKIFVSIGWKGGEDVWGTDTDLAFDPAGIVTRVPATRTEDLLRGKKIAKATPDLPLAGARVVLKPSSFSSAASVRLVSIHESVHALAYKWGYPPSFVAEGLARWAENGRLAGFEPDRTQIRGQFPGFADDLLGGPFDFYDKNYSRNYQCASAIFAYLESTDGVDKVLTFARICYEDARGVRASIKTATGDSVEQLLGKVQSWL